MRKSKFNIAIAMMSAAVLIGSVKITAFADETASTDADAAENTDGGLQPLMVCSQECSILILQEL